MVAPFTIVNQQFVNIIELQHNTQQLTVFVCIREAICSSFCSASQSCLFRTEWRMTHMIIWAFSTPQQNGTFALCTTASVKPARSPDHVFHSKCFLTYCFSSWFRFLAPLGPKHCTGVELWGCALTLHLCVSPRAATLSSYQVMFEIIFDWILTQS